MSFTFSEPLRRFCEKYDEAGRLATGVFQLELARTQEILQRHLAQVERWPSWAKHIKRVELVPKGELTTALKGLFRLANGIRPAFQMAELAQLRQ